MRSAATKASARRYYERNKSAIVARTKERRKTIPRTDNAAAARRRASEWYAVNYDRVRSRNKLPTPTRPEPLVCECCGRPPGKRRLHLDHCHLTDAFRGWLCGRCNKGIGALGDYIGGVKLALQYLQRAYRISVQPKR